MKPELTPEEIARRFADIDSRPPETAGCGHQRRTFRGGPGGGDAGVSYHEAPGAGCRDAGRGGERPLHLHAL